METSSLKTLARTNGLGDVASCTVLMVLEVERSDNFYPSSMVGTWMHALSDYHRNAFQQRRTLPESFHEAYICLVILRWNADGNRVVMGE